ncbi:DUF4038 domain-containing protein [bacterium]|nr:DUF4038 domain-containing protein [bacterium]
MNNMKGDECMYNSLNRFYQLKIHVLVLLVCVINTTSLAFSAEQIAWPLKVETQEIVPNTHKAWLADQKGKPFMWIADTCWFLTFKIKDEDVVHYFKNRKQKGISVIQCMLIPWAREGDDNWFGEYPFHEQKFDRPNEDYWQHVDFVVDAARQHNLTLCMALAWNGCCGEGWDKILRNDYHRKNKYAPLKKYARFIANRYGNAGNVIVFLGGDSSGNRDIFALMAKELKKAAPNLLLAHHPSSWYGHKDTYGIKSSTSLDEHAKADCLDISWTYTYWPGQNNRAHSHPYYLNHMEWNRNQKVSSVVSKVRPYLLGESGYENERGSDLARIRRLMHWNIVCGAIGHGFGNGSIWKLADDWKHQLDSPGSKALGQMNDIFASRPWWKLIPEQPREEFFIGDPYPIAGAETFILSGQEMYDNVLSKNEKRGEKFVAAAKTPDGTLLMAYFPHHYSKGGIEIDMTKLAGPAHASWIDPQNGQPQSIEGSPFPNKGTHRFTPPGKNSHGDKDWLLVLETNPNEKNY